MTVGEPREGHLVVPRTARYWVLGEPEAGELWYALHGYGQLARRFARRFLPIAGAGRRVVVPEALNRFYVGAERGRHGPASVVGATWMTREDRLREIDDYVGYLDRLHDAEGGRPRAAVTVLGFSQGVATAARWTALGRIRPARLVLWGDTVPPDLDLASAVEAWRRVDVVLVRGQGDPAIERGRVEEERARLRDAGIRHRVVEYGGGHDIHLPTLQALAGSSPPTNAT